jgi:hypothetical protein
MSYLFDAFNNNAQQQAAGSQIGGINAGVSQALPSYQTGIGALGQNYGAAINAFSPNINAGNAGVTAYGNAIGANGAVGSAQAQQAFLSNPGYQFQLQQGDNAITAQDAATGMTGSGNEALALSKFNQGLAGTSWNNYVQSLQPYLGFSTANTAGQAGAYQGLGTGLNNAYGNIGNMMYGANTSIGNANANADLGNLTASSNLFNLGGNLASGLMKMSDEKLKEDIEPVGHLADGQTVYRYRMAGEPGHQIGLIAQEVEHYAPESVAEVLPDLRAVNYRTATDRAADLMKLADAANDDHDLAPTPAWYAAELMRIAA